MTILFFGERLDVETKIKKLSPLKLVRIPKNRSDKMEREFLMQWNGITFPPEHFVFLDPPAVDLKNLKPRPDRHVAFIDQEIPKTWKAWAKKLKQEVKTDGGFYQPEQLVELLVKGTNSIPRFERQAAEHLVNSNPGGLNALYWAVQTCTILELQEPISFKDVFEIWPFVVAKGRTYSVNARELESALGSKKAIQMVLNQAETEAYGSLDYMLKACPKGSDRVQWIETLFKGVEDKKWTPKAALSIFTHLCYQEKNLPEWQSNANTMMWSSPALTSLFQLLDIPS